MLARVPPFALLSEPGAPQVARVVLHASGQADIARYALVALCSRFGVAQLIHPPVIRANAKAARARCSTRLSIRSIILSRASR